MLFRLPVIFFSSCLLYQVSFANNISLPDIGDSAGNISPAEEYRTGETVTRNIRRAGGMLDDPLVNEYLHDLGFRLVAATGKEKHPFNFFLINDKAINAFALPGGFIGINAGLISKAKSESELAGVLAHEIAHVTQRHHARQYEQGSSVPIVAAIIAAIVLGSKNADLAHAAIASAAAGSAQSQINFTRENEKEADRIGIELLSNAEFNPSGMTHFFETLDKESRIYGDSIPEFLRTHPVTPARIADAKNRVPQNAKFTHSDSTQFHLIRTRIDVLLTTNKKTLLTQFKNSLQSGNYINKAAAEYGYALALKANKHYKAALTQINQLLEKDPNRIAYILLQAQIMADSGNTRQAISRFKSALLLYPNNTTLTQGYAETLVKANKYTSAQKLLIKKVQQTKNNPRLYQLLSEAEAKLNNPANSHEALAEYYYLLGQTHEALKQLQLGLKISNIDFYLASRMEARAKVFQQEIHELEQ